MYEKTSIKQEHHHHDNGIVSSTTESEKKENISGECLFTRPVSHDLQVLQWKLRWCSG